METFVYFTIGGTEICARVNPSVGARDGQQLRLAADLNNMHVIDSETGLVL
jgi:multiple sugar transport system ATP-binding protein